MHEAVVVRGPVMVKFAVQSGAVRSERTGLLDSRLFQYCLSNEVLNRCE